MHGLGLKIRIKKNRLRFGLKIRVKKNFRAKLSLVQKCLRAKLPARAKMSPRAKVSSCKFYPPCKFDSRANMSSRNFVRSCKFVSVQKCLRAILSARAILTQTPNEDVFEIKLEQNDIHDSMVDLAEQVENNSDGTELSQNVYRFGENVSGSY